MAEVAKGLPPMEPLRSTSNAIAVEGRTQPRTFNSSASTARLSARAPMISSIDASRSMSPASGRYGMVAILPIPRGRTGPRFDTSRNNRPANRLANSRNFGSVAPVRSANKANIASASSSIASSTASSSISPTSGDTCSNCSCRANSRRDIVFLEASFTASSAASPSLATGSPPPGRSLFPTHRPARD